MSTRLSIAAVLGLAALSLLPQHAVSDLRAEPRPSAARSFEGASAPQAPTAAKPVPVIEIAPPEPAPEASAEMVALRRQQVPAKVQPRAAPKAPAPAPEHKDTPATVAKPEAQGEPKKPDQWSDAEIVAALRECVKLLGPIAVEVEAAPPVRQDQCGAPAPVLLRRIGSGANAVEINPPAMLNCAMVAKLHTWVEKTLQPAAQEILGSPIVRLRDASGYVCRNRVGSHANIDKVSEHALANALDVAGFVTASGRTIEVGRHWGPTRRDPREPAKVAEVPSKIEAKATPKPPVVAPEPPKAEPPKAEIAKSKMTPWQRRVAELEKAKQLAIERTEKERLEKERFEKEKLAAAEAERQKAEEKRRETLRLAEQQRNELQRPGRGSNDKGLARTAAKGTPVTSSDADTAASSRSDEALFLRRLHRGACGTFGTVLGPEANEAHREHFHFDLAPRRRSAFCE